jgi:hypothetical protein
MADVKPFPDRDPARSKLASAIAQEAGARRDLQVAEQAAELAARRHWDAQSKLEAMRKEPPAPMVCDRIHFVGRRGQSVQCRGAGAFGC